MQGICSADGYRLQALPEKRADMGDTPFIKFYPSDFLGGTSGLSPAERGVYITLLCLIYENDGPVERHDARLARRCGSPKASFVRILDELIGQGKMIERDGMLFNKRAEKALVDRQTRTQNATHAARAKWSAQAQKTQSNQRSGNAGAVRGQCVGDAKPEARSQILKEPNGSLSFDEFAAETMDELSEASRLYSEAAQRAGWPKVRSMTPARRSALRARLKECGGIDGWREALRRAEQSPHLCGHNDRGWTASFDFLTKQSKFNALLEGQYDARTHNNKPAQMREDRIDPALEQIARLARSRQA